MKTAKVTTIILGILAFLGGGYSAVIYYINIPTEIILAKNVDVASEWMETNIKPATGAEHRSQSIGLTIASVEWGAKFDGVIHLEDGTLVGPELELIDGSGLVQPLTLSGFTQKYGIVANYRAAENTLGFAKDRKFVKHRIKKCIAVFDHEDRVARLRSKIGRK
jgi:hypothetical protein